MPLAELFQSGAGRATHLRDLLRFTTTTRTEVFKSERVEGGLLPSRFYEVAAPGAPHTPFEIVSYIR